MAGLRARLTNWRFLGNLTLIGGLFWIGAGMVIAPVASRNVVKGGEFVLITAHGGVNFYIGNNPHADGWYKTPPGLKGTQEGLIESGRMIAEHESRRSLSDGDVSRFWRNKSIEYLTQNPLEALQLYLKKTFLFWHDYEKPLEGNFYTFRATSSLLRNLPLAFGIVAPLALLGLLLLLGRWRERQGLLGIFVVMYIGTLVLYFVTSRYRLVTVPFLLLAAVHGVWWCIAKLRLREWRPLAGALLLLAGAAFLSNSALFGTEGCKETDLAYSEYDAGTLLMRQEKLIEALPHFARAVELNPEVPFFYGNWGIVLESLGRHREAVEVLETLCRRWPTWPETAKGYLHLATSYESLAASDAARRADWLRKAEGALLASCRIRPGSLQAYQRLATIYAATGRPQQAEAMKQRAAQIEAMIRDN